MIGIDYPFRLDSYGRIETTSKQQKIYTDRILTLLSTIVGQRAMRPEYGVDLTRGIYESGGAYNQGLRVAITKAISQFLPLLSLQDVRITVPGEDGISKVEVSVTLPDLSEGTVTVVTAYMSPNGSIIG
jgi:phage baseplate assembly protein W